MMMPHMPMTSTSTPTPTPVSTSAASASANSRRVPLDKRKRTETSCDKCKSRKQKCRKEPGQDACRYCIVHNIECLTTQPRKKRLYGSVEGLGNRLALLESLVKGLLPEADVNDLEELRHLGSSLGIALPGSVDGEGSTEPNSGSDKEGEEPLSLLPDQQGQVQYIGPASSFSFHLKLRSLIGAGELRSFVLFGRNAADTEPVEPEDARRDSRSLSHPDATTNADHSSPAGTRAIAISSAQPSEVPSLESLIGAYFDHINPDFPVLYEGELLCASSQDAQLTENQRALGRLTRATGSIQLLPTLRGCVVSCACCYCRAVLRALPFGRIKRSCGGEGCNSSCLLSCLHPALLPCKPYCWPRSTCITPTIAMHVGTLLALRCA